MIGPKWMESLQNSWKTPLVTATQQVGAMIVLYSYAVTDVCMLRFLAVTGLICFSVIPNAFRYNTLLFGWGIIFVGINAVRLYELASDLRPVELNADEVYAYSDGGFREFIGPQAFKRFCHAAGSTRDVDAGVVLRHETDASKEVYIVLEGSLDLSTYGKHVLAVDKGGIVGDPDLAKVEEERNLHKVAVTAGKNGARVLIWRNEDLKRSIKKENDPTVEVQLIKFFSSRPVPKSSFNF